MDLGSTQRGRHHRCYFSLPDALRLISEFPLHFPLIISYPFLLSFSHFLSLRLLDIWFET